MHSALLGQECLAPAEHSLVLRPAPPDQWGLLSLVYTRSLDTAKPCVMVYCQD